MSFSLLHLQGCPIAQQLQLEAQLLREGDGNWCLINEGSHRCIVMGVSGKREQLVCPTHLAREPIPVIRRFSGGGTVVVDENTLFVTFICQREAHAFQPFPEPILRWAEEIYKEVFQHPQFCLRENDFVLGQHKCGGNAQYIKKDRWLLHTSFLWDFEERSMAYLLHPPKTPLYRAGRTHEEFLCRLKAHFSSREQWVVRLKQVLSSRYETT